MLPPSWKAEVQKTIDEAAAADKNEQKAQQNEASTKIAAAIDTLRDAQAAQTTSEDTNEKKNQAINKVTLILVAFTVLFTCLSWLAFREQVQEMKVAYGPIKDSADAAKKSADVSEKTLIAAHRPWISVEKIEMMGPLDITQDGGFAPFTIYVKNIGQSPAIRVGIAADLIIRNIENPLERQKAFCAAIRKSLEITAKEDSVIKPERTFFPQQPRALAARASFRPDDFRRYRDWLSRIPGPAALPTLIGCVYYEFAFAEGYHFTGIIVDMNRKSPAPYMLTGPVNAQIPEAVIFDGKTEPDDLNLSYSFVGTGTVD
jgi:hypothetical protein